MPRKCEPTHSGSFRGRSRGRKRKALALQAKLARSWPINLKVSPLLGSFLGLIFTICRPEFSHFHKAKNRGAFLLPEVPEAPDFFSRTADGAPLRAIEARVCSPRTPSPPACARRSLAGSQLAKTAWAELHQPRRTARTSSADRGRQWRATGSSQPRDGAHSAGVGRSPRHGGARQLPSQDRSRGICRSRFCRS